jgi:hypothetical protein
MIAMRNPTRAALGVAVVLAGIPVYYLLFNKRNGLDKNNSV